LRHVRIARLVAEDRVHARRHERHAARHVQIESAEIAGCERELQPTLALAQRMLDAAIGRRLTAAVLPAHVRNRG
jgi:hypothetical protein